MADRRELLAQLHGSVKASWNDVRPRWRDIVAADFEHRYWTEIDQITLGFLAECDRFEDTLSRAESALRNMS